MKNFIPFFFYIYKRLIDLYLFYRKLNIDKYLYKYLNVVYLYEPLYACDFDFDFNSSDFSFCDVD
jgi:hypothetical protein